ncbi:MAG TPA: MMPL family transporter [Byssovorax sp.]
MIALARRLGLALLDAQIARPGRVLLAALASAALALFIALHLQLKTGFGELLPKGKESVQVAERVNQRLVSASTLSIVVEGEDVKALERFVDALAPEIRALGPDLVGNVDTGVGPARAFFAQHALLYAPLADVQKARDAVVDRYAYEVAKRTGGLLDDDDAPPPLEELKKRLDDAQKGTAEKTTDRYPDGYYLDTKSSPKKIAMLVRTSVSSGDAARSRSFRAKIDAVVAKVDPKKYGDAKVGFTGDFITSSEEIAAVQRDTMEVGVVGVVLVLSAVFLFYLRARTLLALGLTIAVGVLWSFAFAYVAVDYLNASTALLVSILVGNGINFGIIYMARYLELRRTEDLEASVRGASIETWKPTLAVAGSALTAYGSLAITEFNGFKQFGVLGGAGMLFCWSATFFVLPALLVGFERILPVPRLTGARAKIAASYGKPFAWLATRAPKTLLAIGGVVGAVAVVLAARYVAADPMEYDLYNIRNETPEFQSGARRLSGVVDEIVGRQGQEGVAILVDRLDQIAPLQKALEARRDAAPEGRKPFDKIVSVADLLPKDQVAKLALLAEVKDKIERAHAHHFVSEDLYAEASRMLSPEAVHPLGVADLPEQVARPFTEKDGTRGRLVYIVPTEGRSVWDAHYLFDWADAFRATTLPDGSVIKGSGRSVVFADLVAAVMHDAPRAVFASGLGTLAIVLLAFRRRSLPILAAVTLGIAVMVAYLSIRGMKLNFLNFIALPISIGVGADYAVNMGDRLRHARGVDEVKRAVVETGGAVILCSMTTTLGYLALTVSLSLAARSFGVAAAAGEIACVFAAVLVLPAAFVLRARRAVRREA